MEVPVHYRDPNSIPPGSQMPLPLLAHQSQIPNFSIRVSVSRLRWKTRLVTTMTLTMMTTMLRVMTTRMSNAISLSH